VSTTAPRSTSLPYPTLFRSPAEVAGRPRPAAHRDGDLLEGLPGDRHRRAAHAGHPDRGLLLPGRQLRGEVGHVHPDAADAAVARSEEHTSELQSRFDLVCRL